MRTAGRDVCDGFEIGVDTDQSCAVARYRDKRPAAENVGNNNGGTGQP